MIIELIIKAFKAIISFFTSPNLGSDHSENDLETLMDLLDQIKEIDNYTEYSIVQDFAKEVLTVR